MLFSTLIPAISFTAVIKLPISLGNISSGGTLTYADLISGTFESEPNFHPVVKGKAIRGGDYISIDPPSSPPSAPILRLHLDGLIETSDDPPAYIHIQATGAEVGTPEVLAVISGAPGAKAVKYGDFQASSSWTFTSGNAKYRELSNAVYVGSTSLRAGGEKGTIVVGFRIARVESVGTGVGV